MEMLSGYLVRALFLGLLSKVRSDISIICWHLGCLYRDRRSHFRINGTNVN